MGLRRTRVIISLSVKMNFFIIASGSKGNCTYIQAGDTRLVLDCGGTKRQLKQAIKELDLELSKIDALLITHDHSDHIAQLDLFAQTPIVFAPYPLAKRVDTQVLMPYMMHPFKEVNIFPLVLSHDSELTYGYVIEWQQERMVYITDTGYVKSKDYDFIKNAQYYIIESNHDVDMLMKSNRPYATKQRILSDNGHLSNEDASYILSQVIGPKTQDIILAHLSEEANQEKLAIQSVWESLEHHQTKVHPQLKVRCARQKEIITGGKAHEKSTQHQRYLAFVGME
jgi:phosphoribosyl 1,2-cyclic phosphodiesterase